MEGVPSEEETLSQPWNPQAKRVMHRAAWPSA